MEIGATQSLVTGNMIAWVVLALLLSKLAMQLCLEWLNTKEVLANAAAVPAPFAGIIDRESYRKTVDYTLAKAQLDQASILYNWGILVTVLFSGLLPWSYYRVQEILGTSSLAMVAWLLTVAIVMSFTDLPLDWYSQFRLEERFGFNTTTLRTWLTDRVKGTLLAILLGGPLLWLILKIVDWTGAFWWLWAWGAITAFQLVMTVLAPVLILPLFNKLTSLAPGPLRNRLLQLGEKTGFHAKNILVMDGSKRSRHSNAFFTGFGRFRKIVLFDTLIQQLKEDELEAVLAHEIGHYKKGHVPRMLLAAFVGTLIGLAIIAWLARQPQFYEAFGLPQGSIVPALLLFSLLSGTVTFWLSPFGNLFSRKYEYQADAFAAQIMASKDPLVGALRKLNEQNASNLTPHPIYSGFYYSHPTLLEREQALTLFERGANQLLDRGGRPELLQRRAD